MTLRDLQKTDDQWARAKGFDGSAPLGPWIETDLDPNDAVVETRAERRGAPAGAARPTWSTASPRLIEYITAFMTLLPGDVLLTGTPEGVGPLALRRRGRGRGRRRRRAREHGAMTDTPVRCRFAPAPSGSLHVGNVRSALFSWLFARHNAAGRSSCAFEDTDASRVTEEAVAGVLEDLRWLGIDHDEGPDVGGPHEPYRQSQRLDIYREHADQLLAQGDAYRCYCTAEELEHAPEGRAGRTASHPATTATAGP